MKSVRKWVGPVGVALLATAGVAFTNAVAGQAPGVTTITSDWQVDLRTIGAVGSVVLAGVVWITKKLAGIEAHMKSTNERFNRIDKCLQNMPCRNGTCFTKEVINETQD